MATVTLQIPLAQIGWFEQMVHSMGWSFHIEETSAAQEKKQEITPALRRRINKARKEYAAGETITCRTQKEMQQFFDSL
ncbi:MAG: hypothetical protein IKO26_07465 [Paludibacteraceae bacterium]|nr:hypothetical protein [Paludibacteraceae bacterium]